MAIGTFDFLADSLQRNRNPSAAQMTDNNDLRRLRLLPGRRRGQQVGIDEVIGAGRCGIWDIGFGICRLGCTGGLHGSVQGRPNGPLPRRRWRRWLGTRWPWRIGDLGFGIWDLRWKSRWYPLTFDVRLSTFDRNLLSQPKSRPTLRAVQRG